MSEGSTPIGRPWRWALEAGAHEDDAEAHAIPDQVEDPSGGPGGRRREGRWRWQPVDDSEQPARVPDQLAGRRFPSRDEAESWIGECWADLLEAGVDQVVLYDGERRVYAMPLHAS